MHRVIPLRRCSWVGLVLALWATSVRPSAGAEYDPLAISGPSKAGYKDFSVNDAKRDREIPIRVHLPDSTAPAPVVLFSHGLGGSRENGKYIAEHWTARGYVGVFMQHKGSDSSVWQGKPLREIMPAMKAAAGGENFLLRVKDVPAVIDQLEQWNKTAGHPLAGRLDLGHLGMSGHSFGAITTQAVSGQSLAKGSAPMTDPRIKAAVIFSPSSPRRGIPPETAFGGVKIPWLLMTGTKDISPIGDIDVASRLAVYPALPPGNKYELVLEGGEHSAFGDRGLRMESGSRNPNHHRIIKALSTAFWDAYLRNNAAAKAWLDGEGPRTILEKDDRWQKK